MKRVQVVLLMTTVIVVALWTLNFITLYSKLIKDTYISKVKVRRRGKFSGPVADDEQIMFAELSCILDPSTEDVTPVRLTARQACAVESAAKSNPQTEVYVLSTCRVLPQSEQLSPSYVRQLLTYPNVHVWHLNVWELLSDTPLESWYYEGYLMKNVSIVDQAQVVVRLIALWKYPGTFLNLDLVVMRSFSGMKNFAGAGYNDNVETEVLNFARDKIGREVSGACLGDLWAHFKDTDWNVSTVVTRTLKYFCNTTRVWKMTPRQCQGFTVLDPFTFSPIPPWNWMQYFDEKSFQATMTLIEESVAIHVWSDDSAHEKVTVGSRQPYALVAQKYCPKVYSNCGSVF